MYLDVQSINTNGLDCVESAVATVAHWYRQEFIRIFAHVWSFHYPEPYSSWGSRDSGDLFGKHVEFCKDDRWDLMQRHYGLDITFHNKQSFEDSYANIRRELECGRPIIISADAFWIPWDHAYQKSHFEYHYVTCVGVDEKEGNLVCIDSFSSQEKAVLLPVDHYRQNFWRIVEVHPKEEIQAPEDVRDMLAHSMERILGKVGGLDSAFDNMRRFASDAEPYMNPKEEIKGYDPKWRSPMNFQIISTYNARTKFALVVKALSDREDLRGLLEFVPRLEQAVMKWRVVESLFCKGIAEMDHRSAVSRFAACIRRAADFEEELARDMLEFLQKGS